MCGLLGVVGTAPIVGFVESRLDLLEHRGPNDRGLWRSESGDVVLGHRRLSVIDLSAAGHQPMVVGDGTVVVVLNGEIYNYREIRELLRAKGHYFASDSDTEVLAVAYLEWGRHCIDRFIGMWAFALYDRRSGEVWLSRDPFGIKPLFVVVGAEFLAFASEIPPLLPLAPGKANLQVAFDYLRWGHVDRGEASFVEGITQLGAGQNLVVPSGRPDSATCSRPSYSTERLSTNDISREEAATRLRTLLERSVALHMRSDVPLGCALSGGVDSSAIVMLMRQIGGPQLELNTFSYRATGELFDESAFIDLVSKAAGTHQHDIVISRERAEVLLPAVIDAQFEPFGSLSILAQHEVFGRARAHGTVVMLDGQGADELFAGYPSFRAERLADLVRSGQLAAAKGVARRIQETGGNGAVARSLARALPHRMALKLWSRWMHTSSPDWLQVEWFASRGVQVSPDPTDLPRSFDEAIERSQTTSSLPGLLRYEDRNSMGHSVESRVPFLTRELVDFANSLPHELLIDAAGRNKSILIEALRGCVPEEVLERRDKVAFRVPEEQWVAAHSGLQRPNQGTALGILPRRRMDLRSALWINFIERTGLEV